MEKLQLKEEDYFGKGNHKKCYLHPTNKAHCVKVIYNDNNGKAWKELKRELDYYLHLKKKNCTSAILPHYYGEVSTNLGPGYVYDAIKDYNGELSKDLHHYLLSTELLESNFSQLSTALKELKEQMLNENLVTLGLYAQNIMCKKESSQNIKMLIIDNIGTGSWIPIEYMFDYFTRARTGKRWSRMMDLIKENHKDTLVLKLIDEVTS